MALLTTVTKFKNIDRRLFYYEDDIEKPISAGGVLLFKKDEVLVQKIQKDDTFQYSDFGGKTDLEDKSIMETIARELGEEMNFGIIDKKDGKNMDSVGIKKFLQNGLKKKLYFPNAKYFLIFVQFNENKYSLSMDQIGQQEELDQIPRTVEWITFQQFIDSHFSHNLHPRLWGKPVLEFFGYQSKPDEVEEIIKPIKRFGFV